MTKTSRYVLTCLLSGLLLVGDYLLVVEAFCVRVIPVRPSLTTPSSSSSSSSSRPLHHDASARNIPKRTTTTTLPPTPWRPTSLRLWAGVDECHPKRTATRKLLAKPTNHEDNDDDDNNNLAQQNFDAQGFGGYLAPYALALVASVVATAAFVKFVLLDY